MSEWLPEVRGDALCALEVLRAVQNDKRAIGTEKLCAQSLAKASGVAFLHQVRIGAGVTVGGGRGFVMNRLPDGGWSAPVFFTLDQAGLGLSLGVSEVESVLVLDSPQLVDWFSQTGPAVSTDVTVAEPLEQVGVYRNLNDLAESNGAFRFSTAHGAIVDWSIQGTLLRLANGKNAALYGAAPNKDILGGKVETPAPIKDVQVALAQIASAASA